MTEDLGEILKQEYKSMRASLNVNVPELTGKILKQCNVVRDKQYGSTMLKKHTGIAAGARSGSFKVHQPILDLQKVRARSSEGNFRLSALRGNTAGAAITESTGADSMLYGDAFSLTDYYPNSRKLHIRKHIKEVRNVQKMPNGTYRVVGQKPKDDPRVLKGALNESSVGES